MTLKEVLSNRNAEGKVYISDCRRLLGGNVDYKIAQELQEMLTGLADEKMPLLRE